MSSLADSVRSAPSGSAPITSGRSPAAALEVRIWLNWSSATAVSSTVDTALLGEGVDDLLGRGDPVGEVLDDPDGDAVAVAASTSSSAVVVAAAGGESGDETRRQEGGSGAAQPGPSGQTGKGHGSLRVVSVM